MKIVIINGSHRIPGNCSYFSRNTEELLTQNGHDVRSFNLIQSDIQPCKGCLICEDGENCPIQDDFSAHIEPAMEWADLIIMATPTYFNMPSSAMVNFLDRTNKMCSYFSENPKKCMFYLSGQTDHDTIMDAYRCMHTYSEIMGMEEIAEPLIHVARMPEQTPAYILQVLKNI